MPKLKVREKVTVRTEKQILTGMIVSKEYMQSIYPLISLSYFKSSFIRTVAEWALSFYEQYEDIPFDNIQSIFHSEEPNLKEEDAKLISTLLTNISKKYEREKGLNIPYLTDETEKYFKQRELEITSGNLKILLERGDIEEAEHQISHFRKIQKLTSDWIDPLDNKEIDKTFQQMDMDFFRFPGRLGQFLGNMERGWLIGMEGAFKRGKTWFLQEFAVMGILSNLRIAFFSLEMNEQKIKERLYKRMTGGYEEGGKLQFPCFDCAKNQDDSCEMEIRTCDEPVPMDYSDNGNYVPCTECRGNGTNNYEIATWFETLEVPPFDISVVGDKLAAWQRNYNDLIRIKAYPRYSANISDIRRDLDLLEQLDGFIADIILVDYADILKPENENSVGVDKEDRTWIALSQLAAERFALTVAPTQITKSGQDADSIKMEHTAKWVGKLGHVDGMLFVHQTEEEKRAGIMNLGIKTHRHKEFNIEQTCKVLQNLKTGQPNLDSEF